MCFNLPLTHLQSQKMLCSSCRHLTVSQGWLSPFFFINEWEIILTGNNQTEYCDCECHHVLCLLSESCHTPKHHKVGGGGFLKGLFSGVTEEKEDEGRISWYSVSSLSFVKLDISTPQATCCSLEKCLLWNTSPVTTGQRRSSTEAGCVIQQALHSSV